MSQFVDDFMPKVYGKIPDQYLEVIMRELELHSADYTIDKYCKDIIPYSSYVPECLKTYLVGRIISGFSKNTVYNDKLYLEDMFNMIQKEFSKITADDIRLYLYNIQKLRSLSNRTLDSRRSIISVFFKWANSEGYLEKNPTANIRRIKYSVKAREPLDDYELEMVRMACETTREKAMLEFFYATGCRVSELARLNWSDINLDKREVLLLGKGNKYRTSNFTEKAKLLLIKYLAERTDTNEAVFIGDNKNHQRLSVRRIQIIIGNIGKRSGINRKLFPHLLRHTTATNLLRHGMEVTSVQKCLGHSRIDTTMTYVKVNGSQVKSDYQKYMA